jgi:hypothetical protein
MKKIVLACSENDASEAVGLAFHLGLYVILNEVKDLVAPGRASYAPWVAPLGGGSRPFHSSLVPVRA